MTTASDSFLFYDKEKEKIFICYLLKNPQSVSSFDKNLLKDSFYKSIFNVVENLVNSDIQIDSISVYDACRIIATNVTKKDIEDLFNTSYDFKNIDYIITQLKQYDVKSRIVTTIEKLASKSVQNEDFELKDLENLSDLLQNQIVSLRTNSGLYSCQEMSTIYKDILEKRKLGLQKRTVGYPELDEVITRPLASGEMTALVGWKGYGKSAFKENIKNSLINQRICVVSFEPEMEMESSYDRLLCIREGLSLQELFLKEKDRRLEQKIDRGIEKINAIPNYFYVPDPDISIAGVEEKILKAKEKFQDLKVLPEDGYMVVTFDLFEMLTDFDNADPIKIKTNMNKFHRVIRKYKLPAFIVLQANENKIRTGKIFKKPEDLDFFKVGKEDIEGGAAFASRARLVMSLNRPTQMKKEFFPERNEEWNLEIDTINIHGVKQNDGNLFFRQFSFDENTFRIRALRKQSNQCIQE